MPEDLTPFLPETWFAWLNGMSRERYQTWDVWMCREDRMTIMMWMVRQPLMQGWPPEDVANALTPQEREVLLRVWRESHANAADS